MKVEFSLQHLKVVIEGKTIIDKDFPEKIDAEDSIWALEDGTIQSYKGTPPAKLNNQKNQIIKLFSVFKLSYLFFF